MSSCRKRNRDASVRAGTDLRAVGRGAPIERLIERPAPSDRPTAPIERLAGAPPPTSRRDARARAPDGIVVEYWRVSMRSGDMTRAHAMPPVVDHLPATIAPIRRAWAACYTFGP
ncbi:hypothetical protein GCM10009626_21000 [Brachybacterium sacelli]